MSLFDQAAVLNNRGVNLLLRGDRNLAIESMGASIKLMKRAVSNIGTSSVSSFSPPPSSYETNGPQTVEIDFGESVDDTSIVFTQAILIPHDGFTGGEIEMNISASAVIFNLALVHQFKNDAASMIKAEKLYTMAIQILQGKRIMSSYTALLVKLACINNLSQIRYSRGDYKAAREGLSQISSLIRESSRHGTASLLEEPEMQCLLMNVLCLKAPCVAPAA